MPTRQQLGTFSTACLAIVPVAVLALILVQTASAAPSYTITLIGLAGPEHTRDDGYKNGYMYSWLNASGDIGGVSYRFNGSSDDLGRSVWVYDGTTTKDIGLTGDEYSGADDYKFCEANEMNGAGQVLGYANRYDGAGADLGRSVWLYDGQTTKELGLTGAEYMRSDGYKSSPLFTYEQRYLNETGQVIGLSDRFSGSTALGNAAWFYNGSTTVPIGLTDSEHTGANDYRTSRVRALSNAGIVVGESDRFNGGSAYLGSSAWYYNGATTTEIGLTGAAFIRNDGYRRSVIGWHNNNARDYNRLNEAGQVIGTSVRFSSVEPSGAGSNAWLYDGHTTKDISLDILDGKFNIPYAINIAGQVLGISTGLSSYIQDSSRAPGTAWLYDGVTTKNIGLDGKGGSFAEIGLAHVVKLNARPLNEAGQVTGYSFLGNGENAAWIYNGAETIRIGLSGPEFISPKNVSGSFPAKLNESGQVIGHSHRYVGDGSAGNGNLSAWLYDGSTTIDVGLSGSEYTNSTGAKFSTVRGLNEVGQVIGVSDHYDGSTYLGQDAWLYDPSLQQTIPLPRLSARSDGYATAYPFYLGEDGLVLGQYDQYDAADFRLGTRAFYFTLADGMHDLGSLVDGGLMAAGWDSLASAVRSNSAGQILGYGKLNTQSGGQIAYLLTPTTNVPEPSTLLLAGLALVPFSWRRRRVRSSTCLRIANRRFTAMLIALLAFLAAAPAQSQQLFKLTASDAAASDFFGTSVALSGNTALISAAFDDDSGDNSGSAYVFDASTGQQSRKLTASDASADDNFGYSVALNGNIALIGASRDDNLRGSAYVFDAATGQQLRKLRASDGAAEDLFGCSVALSGNLAIVGARWDNLTGDGSYNSGHGAAYIFNVNTGQQLRKLTASDAATDDQFGVSVALSGNRAIVGAWYDDDGGSYSGSAYVFDATTGQQLFKLTASDAAEIAQFGGSVAIDGNYAIIGAHGANNERGAAYLFDVTTGQQLYKLVGSDATAGEWCGQSVALYGNIAAVGAIANGSVYQKGDGSVYLFDVTSGNQIAKLTAADGASVDGFGGSVALNGNMALIGASANDDDGSASGSAYVFRVAPVPEPSTLLLAALALVPFVGRRRLRPGDA